MALALFLLSTFAVAALGGLFPPGPWYDALAKPSWNPPGWVFGPVWTVLYVCIGTSAWLVWRQRDTTAVAAALVLWGLQLLLNASWSPVFFGMQRLGLAFVTIVAMWGAIGATIAAFGSVDRTAALLLLPYFGWVSFAAVLNGVIWRMNFG